jgi:hypothetical protein
MFKAGCRSAGPSIAFAPPKEVAKTTTDFKHVTVQSHNIAKVMHIDTLKECTAREAK